MVSSAASLVDMPVRRKTRPSSSFRTRPRWPQPRSPRKRSTSAHQATWPSSARKKSARRLRVPICADKRIQYPHPESDVYLKELKIAQDLLEGKGKPAADAIVVAEPDAEAVQPAPSSAALGAPPTEIARSAVEEAVATGIDAPQPMDEDKPAASAALGAPPAEIARQAVDEALAQQDTPDVPVRFMEKKSLHWEGKTCA
jgi:hypothetical protein